MSIGPYKVYKLKIKDRKKTSWNTSAKLKEGLNIIRTFKDDNYWISIKGPKIVDNSLSKAIKVDKLSLIEVLAESRPMVVVITRENKGYIGTVERIEFEEKGIIIKRKIANVILKYLDENVTLRYTDIDEVYIRPLKRIWGILAKYRKDDYYYEGLFNPL